MIVKTSYQKKKLVKTYKRLICSLNSLYNLTKRPIGTHYIGSKTLNSFNIAREMLLLLRVLLSLRFSALFQMKAVHFLKIWSEQRVFSLFQSLDFFFIYNYKPSVSRCIQPERIYPKFSSPLFQLKKQHSLNGHQIDTFF